jgi:hypothetical protein
VKGAGGMLPDAPLVLAKNERAAAFMAYYT